MCPANKIYIYTFLEVTKETKHLLLILVTDKLLIPWLILATDSKVAMKKNPWY